MLLPKLVSPAISLYDILGQFPIHVFSPTTWHLLFPMDIRRAIWKLSSRKTVDFEVYAPR
jgi:hypothetical protein